MFTAKDVTDLTKRARKLNGNDIIIDILEQAVIGRYNLMFYDDYKPNKKVLDKLKKLGFNVTITINKTPCLDCKECFINDKNCVNMEVEQLTRIDW